MSVDPLMTDRLLLRRWIDADRQPFAELNADPDVMRHFPAPLTEEASNEFVDRVEAHFDEHGFGLWAVELRDASSFVGFVGLWTVRFEAHFSPAVEIGWRLAKAHWGHGLAPEAASAALADGFERLGLDEIVSFTARPNLASQRVMQKIGMTHDPSDDFDHPNVDPPSALRPHVLYRMSRRSWALRSGGLTSPVERPA